MRTERVAEKIAQLSPNFQIIPYFNVIKFQRLSQEQLLSNSSRIVRLRDGFDTTGYVPQKKHEDFFEIFKLLHEFYHLLSALRVLMGRGWLQIPTSRRKLTLLEYKCVKKMARREVHVGEEPTAG